MHEVSLAILVGPADATFAEEMVAHIVGANRFAFKQRILVIDTPRNVSESSPNRVREMIQLANSLRDKGLIDQIFGLGEAHSRYAEWGRKHFGKSLKWDRDYRGCPLFGWIAGFEACESDYHVHFDCDVLLHQQSDFSWIDEGIRLLREDPSLMCVMPHPGPPRNDGILEQPGPYFEDSPGFYRFRTFSSRRFLISRNKYDSLLPMTSAYASRRHYLKSLISRASPVQNWEEHVNSAIQRIGLSRAALNGGQAWTLHAPDHGPEFQERIGSIIADVENGRFPAGQAGCYDLKLDEWR